MTHISKKELDKSEFDKIFRELVRALHNCTSENEKSGFLWQLFTPTEKIMLSKRFAMIYMLEAGKSTYEITQVLNISPSTIARISRKWDKGGYLKVVMKNSHMDKFEKLLYSLHTVGGIMPPKIKFKKRRT